MPNCAHNYRDLPNYEHQQSYHAHRSPRVLHRNDFGSYSVSQNNSTSSKVQNCTIKTQTACDFESDAYSMELFGPGVEPPDDFHPHPPSECGEGDDEEDQENMNFSSGRVRSEPINRPRINPSTRRVNSVPVGPSSPCKGNTDTTRRHSHPLPKRGCHARKDCESDGDIPNIPDACTCYRTPVIQIGKQY
jgi:hypothetical protein